MIVVSDRAHGRDSDDPAPPVAAAPPGVCADLGHGEWSWGQDPWPCGRCGRRHTFRVCGRCVAPDLDDPDDLDGCHNGVAA